MFKKTIGALFATTYASADINTDFHGLLNGSSDMQATELGDIWTQFKLNFSETSPVDLENDHAMNTFFANVDSIREHNSRTDKTFTRVINKYAAMTFQEFDDYYHLSENNLNADQNCSATGRISPLTEGDEANSSAPLSWNWCNHGGVSPVKDQGSCGSCWTFSTVGCLESANLIQTGLL